MTRATVLRLVLTHVAKFEHPESGHADTAQALLRNLESMNHTSLTVLTDRGNDPCQTPTDNLKRLVETVGTEVFKEEEDSGNLAPNVFAMWGTRPDDPAAKSAVL